MKRIFIFLLFFVNIMFSYGQYNKEKLTDILTGGNTRSWTVKGTSHSEKSYSFSKNATVQTLNSSGASQNLKWELTTADNIRWFILIGKQRYELIVSYDKSGKQFVKFTGTAGDKSSVYSETILYPSK